MAENLLQQPNGDGNGVNIKGPGFGAEVKGRWGAVLILVALACACLVVVTYWGMNELVRATDKGHEAIKATLQELKASGEKGQCLLALPADSEERIAALRYDWGPCEYLLYVYTPRSGSIPPARPKPRATPRAPGVPDRHETPPERPTFPSTGFPAQP